VVILRKTWNKKSAKYLKGINFLQLTLAKKTEIKNSGHSAPDLVISQLSSSSIQSDVKKLNLLYTLNVSDSAPVLKEMLYWAFCLII
jgi:hypothetical protein